MLNRSRAVSALAVVGRLACVLLVTQAQASATKCPENINTAIWHLFPSNDAIVIQTFPTTLMGVLYMDGPATLSVVANYERDGEFVLELERIP